MFIVGGGGWGWGDIKPNFNENLAGEFLHKVFIVGGCCLFWWCYFFLHLHISNVHCCCLKSLLLLQVNVVGSSVAIFVCVCVSKVIII